MLLQQALPLALLAACTLALPSPPPLLKRAGPLPPGVNHSLEISAGEGPLTQCSPVNITWSEAVQPEGEAVGAGQDYVVTVDARMVAQKALVYYEQRTFLLNESRVWEWPVDVPSDSTVSIMVASFEGGNSSKPEGDVWYGAIERANVTLGSSDDSCIPDVNRPIIFDESQLASIRSCEPTELLWSGSAPPYEVWLYTQNTIAGAGNGRNRISLGETNETSLTWEVDFPAGLSYFLEIRAANSFRSYSMTSASALQGETGNCTIPELHQLTKPISAASLSAAVSALWILAPSVALWMAAA